MNPYSFMDWSAPPIFHGLPDQIPSLNRFASRYNESNLGMAPSMTPRGIAPLKHLLLVSPDQGLVELFHDTLGKEYEICTARDLAGAGMALARLKPEFAFLEVDLVAEDDLKPLFAGWRELCPGLGLAVMCRPETTRKAVAAIKAGADDYLTHPILPGETLVLIQALSGAKRRDAELLYLRAAVMHREQVLTETRSPAMRDVFKALQSVVGTHATVLLHGETGVGKSMFAKWIHRQSPRAGGPFIYVNCGAVPETLIESELFGHEKGSFTGAVRRKLGKFELAHGGSIFLDEIGTLSPATQVKLLHVLQDGALQRLGSESEIRVNVRVISATNEDLKARAESGSFRADLYYRLNVFPIQIPPLRERREDIPALAQRFLDELNQTHDKGISRIHTEVIEVFQTYPWPGNIRELQNLMERAYILETTEVVRRASLPAELYGAVQRDVGLTIHTELSLQDARARVITEFESRYLNEVLTRYKGRIAPAAEAAGIGVRQLHKLMTKYGIRKEDFKADKGQVDVEDP